MRYQRSEVATDDGLGEARSGGPLAYIVGGGEERWHATTQTSRAINQSGKNPRPLPIVVGPASSEAETQTRAAQPARDAGNEEGGEGGRNDVPPDARRPRAAHDLIALRCGVADGGGMEREDGDEAQKTN